jgi:hypothetical protein
MKGLFSMTQADSVHSTPPTNTSPTRRNILGTIAAAGATALTLTPARALTAADPIFGIIERHRAARVAHKEAVRIEFAFEELHMQGEKLRQYQAFQEQTGDAWDRLEDASVDLVNTPPTTLAGIAALCRYLAPLLADQDTVDLPETITLEDDTESTPAGALANSIAVAIREISRGLS